MKLTAIQAQLLNLIGDAGHLGCVVYGRAYAASADALSRRGLISASLLTVNVASMGHLERRPVYHITSDGVLLRVELKERAL